MILSIEHFMLVNGADLDSCSQRVRNFFNKSQLVHYDLVEVDREKSVHGTDPGFENALNMAIAKNHAILADLLNKLKGEGYTEMGHLLELPQGFQSKLLHTMCHLLDGFFGVDSRFFDIDEISNWLTENRRQQIHKSPEECWLIHVNAKSFYGGGFEKKSS